MKDVSCYFKELVTVPNIDKMILFHDFALYLKPMFSPI